MKESLHFTANYQAEVHFVDNEITLGIEIYIKYPKTLFEII